MKSTRTALLWITNVLEMNKIPYKITGGFAARVYGVDRELADIDIDVANAALELLQPIVRPYITFGLARYTDEQWDADMITLCYEGQEIDLVGIEANIFDTTQQKWVRYPTSIEAAVLREVFGKQVMIESVETLIRCKTMLDRDVDREDVRQLLRIGAGKVTVGQNQNPRLAAGI